MFLVESIQPRIEPGHARTTVELSDDGLARQRRDVQTRIPGLGVEVVGKADVPARHTHTIHTVPRQSRGGQEADRVPAGNEDGACGSVGERQPRRVGHPVGAAGAGRPPLDGSGRGGVEPEERPR